MAYLKVLKQSSGDRLPIRTELDIIRPLPYFFEDGCFWMQTCLILEDSIGICIVVSCLLSCSEKGLSMTGLRCIIVLKKPKIFSQKCWRRTDSCGSGSKEGRKQITTISSAYKAVGRQNLRYLSILGMLIIPLYGGLF